MGGATSIVSEVDGDSQSQSSPPIVQYWHEDEPPDYIEELFASFRERNPDMRHLVFDESSAASLIKEHLGARELAAFHACAVPAMQADYFRYCAVHALGGIYSDADFGCKASLRSLAERDGGTLFGDMPTINGFFAFEPGHSFLRLALRVATANIESRFSQSVWGTTGPAIFSALVALHRVGSIDAFVERTKTDPPGLGRDGRPMWNVQIFCEAVDDYAEVTAAFEQIRVLPLNQLDHWVFKQPGRAPYKQTDSHYLYFKSSIYRSSP